MNSDFGNSWYDGVVFNVLQNRATIVVLLQDNINVICDDGGLRPGDFIRIELPLYYDPLERIRSFKPIERLVYSVNVRSGKPFFEDVVERDAQSPTQFRHKNLGAVFDVNNRVPPHVSKCRVEFVVVNRKQQPDHSDFIIHQVIEDLEEQENRKCAPAGQSAFSSQGQQNRAMPTPTTVRTQGMTKWSKSSGGLNQLVGTSTGNNAYDNAYDRGRSVQANKQPGKIRARSASRNQQGGPRSNDTPRQSPNMERDHTPRIAVQNMSAANKGQQNNRSPPHSPKYAKNPPSPAQMAPAPHQQKMGAFYSNRNTSTENGPSSVAYANYEAQPLQNNRMAAQPPNNARYQQSQFQMGQNSPGGHSPQANGAFSSNVAERKKSTDSERSNYEVPSNQNNRSPTHPPTYQTQSRQSPNQMDQPSSSKYYQRMNGNNNDKEFDEYKPSVWVEGLIFEFYEPKKLYYVALLERDLTNIHRVVQMKQVENCDRIYLGSSVVVRIRENPTSKSLLEVEEYRTINDIAESKEWGEFHSMFYTEVAVKNIDFEKVAFHQRLGVIHDEKKKFTDVTIGKIGVDFSCKRQENVCTFVVQNVHPICQQPSSPKPSNAQNQGGNVQQIHNYENEYYFGYIFTNGHFNFYYVTLLKDGNHLRCRKSLGEFDVKQMVRVRSRFGNVFEISAVEECDFPINYGISKQGALQFEVVALLTRKKKNGKKMYTDELNIIGEIVDIEGRIDDDYNYNRLKVCVIGVADPSDRNRTMFIVKNVIDYDPPRADQ